MVYSLDCADLDRIGAGKELFDSAKKRVMIDHHISNPVFGDVNYVKGEIGSACEVLYTLFEEDKINYNVAMCLYTGMVHWRVPIFQCNTRYTYTRGKADCIWHSIY